MDEDILVYHVLGEQAIQLDNDSDEYVDMVARSFGTDVKTVRKIQRTALRKKTMSRIRSDFYKVLYTKTMNLLKENGSRARENFIVNVLAPYLNEITLKESSDEGEFPIALSGYEEIVCMLYGKFFDDQLKDNSLRRFINDLNQYKREGHISNMDNLKRLNDDLLGYNLFVEWNVGGNINVLQIEDVVLPSTRYKDDSIMIIGVKKIVPGLHLKKKGYTTGYDRVIVLNDMVKLESEEIIAEVQQNRFFSRYTDKRFERYWHSIKLDLNVEKASKYYNKLLKKDFLGKPKSFVKQALSMEIAVREAKRIYDRIELPKKRYLDTEFSVYLTSAILGPTPNVALLSAVQQMEKYGYRNSASVLSEMTRKLWELARRSANDETYTDDSLRRDLMQIYCDYRTIDDHFPLVSLEEFNRQIVTKIADYYDLKDSLPRMSLNCQDYISH